MLMRPSGCTWLSVMLHCVTTSGMPCSPCSSCTLPGISCGVQYLLRARPSAMHEASLRSTYVENLDTFIYSQDLELSEGTVLHKVTKLTDDSACRLGGATHHHGTCHSHAAVALHASAHHEAVPRLKDVEAHPLPR